MLTPHKQGPINAYEVPHPQDNLDNVSSKLIHSKTKTKTKYTVNENGDWYSAEITSRAGKATGKNRNWWDIKSPSRI